MGGAVGTVLVVAVVVIAVAQIGLIIISILVARRLIGQVLPLVAALTEATTHLQEATDRIGALAEQANESIGAAHQALAQVGAIVGAGRSLIERAVGAALLRRLLPAGLGGAATGAMGTAAVVKTGINLALGAWRAAAARRARREQEAPPTGTRSGQAALPQMAAADGAGRAAGHGAPPKARLRAGSVRRIVQQGADGRPTTP